MQNTSRTQTKINRTLACLVVFAACCSMNASAEGNVCGSAQQAQYASRIGEIISKACIGPDDGAWLIKRAKSQRYEIYAPAFQVHPIFFSKTTKNRDAELVGGENNIRFLTNRIVEAGGMRFLPALFAYRSRDNNGSGTCGAGLEISLIPIKIEDKKFRLEPPVLIESCLKDIYLDSDGPDKWTAASVNDEGKITIRWQSYFGFRGPVTGEFDMRSGDLKITGEKQ